MPLIQLRHLTFHTFCLLNVYAVSCFSRNKSAVAVRQPYIRVVGIEETNEATRGPANFTTEEVTVPCFF